MKKTISFLIIISIFTSITYATNFCIEHNGISLLNKTNTYNSLYKKKFRRKVFAGNAFYAEAFGLGYKWSVNYDRILDSQERYMLTARVGYGMYKNDANVSTSRIPLTINFLYGKKHFLELGGGMVYTTDHSNVLPAGDIGYRFQNKKGGIVIRLMATATVEPFYSSLHNKEQGKEIIPYGGISFGYSF